MAYRRIAYIAALAALSGSAEAATIDFNNLQPTPGQFYGDFTSYEQDGYRATATNGNFAGSFYNGYIYDAEQSPELIANSGTLSITGPGLFSLTSFDAFAQYAGPDTERTAYTVTGYRAGASVYSSSGSIGYPPPGVIVTNPRSTYGGFTSALFDRVDIQLASYAGVYLDNIVLNQAVTAVPEPATWALMIGGFGMVGGTMRHRRRAVPVRA